MTQNSNINGDNYSAGRDLILQQNQKTMSRLADIINKLVCVNIDDSILKSNNFNSFQIDDKVEYNSLIKYKEIFNEVSPYFGKLNELYALIEQEQSWVVNRILYKIHSSYLQEKDREISSDSVVDNVFTKLKKEVVNSENSPQFIEDIEWGLHLILFDAFMRCKILEEPK